jgi:hypothetical protein
VALHAKNLTKDIAPVAEGPNRQDRYRRGRLQCCPTLLTTLDRIPLGFRSRFTEVIVDDASHSDTFDLGREWAARPDSPTTHVIRHTKNLGYGGNQKAAHALAIEHGLDVVVLLHGDGQYARRTCPRWLSFRARRLRGGFRFADDGEGRGHARRDARLQAARQPGADRVRESGAGHGPQRVPLGLSRLHGAVSCCCPCRTSATGTRA